MEYSVKEILNTVQGEGTQLGRRCTFIRLSGCNLRCPWCDTKETWETEKIDLMSIEEIISKCKHNYVILTGGEPTVQDIGPLIEALKNEGFFVGIESNGTNPIPKQELLDWVAISPKPIDYEIHKSIMPHEIKLVVDETLTTDFVYEVLRQYTYVVVLLQPEANTFKKSVERALEIMDEIENDYLMLGIQAHKFWEVD